MTKREERQEAAQIRGIARSICRVAGTASCVMDDHPERPLCDEKNCRMFAVAMRAIEIARAGQ